MDTGQNIHFVYSGGKGLGMKQAFESKPQPGISHSETVLVSFRVEGGTAKGAFRFAEETFWVPFCGLDDLMMNLEEELEQKEPRWEAFRSLGGRCSRHREKLASYSPQSRPKYTAIIRIYYRQHLSMQGELEVSAGKRVCFRSALELMFLLRELTEDYWAKEEKERNTL